MKDKICATLTKEHIYECSMNVIGRSGENECTQLEIALDECLCDYWVYLDFIKPDGTTYKTAKLEIVDNKITYDLPNTLLSQNGTLKVQVVLQNENSEIWKSTIKSYTVFTSINATDDIPNQDDFITEAQRLLNEVEEGLTPTIGENGNWFILDKDTGKSSQGIQGEKGEKGDAGSIKFIITNELPTENIEDNAMYLIPSSTPSEENTYEEYVYANSKFERVGSASVNVDLDGYVKFTDIATATKAGVVTVQPNGLYGVGWNETAGLFLTSATDPEIEKKTTANRAISPRNLDYAVKTSITTNANVLTDEEKAQAQEWLGVTELVGDIETLLGGI